MPAGAVKAGAGDHRLRPVLDRLQLGEFATEQNGPGVPGERQPQQEIGLAATGRAAIEQDVGRTVISLGLWPRQRRPAPPLRWRRSRPQQPVELRALGRRQAGEPLFQRAHPR